MFFLLQFEYESKHDTNSHRDHKIHTHPTLSREESWKWLWRGGLLEKSIHTAVESCSLKVSVRRSRSSNVPVQWESHSSNWNGPASPPPRAPSSVWVYQTEVWSSPSLQPQGEGAVEHPCSRSVGELATFPSSPPSQCMTSKLFTSFTPIVIEHSWKL